MGLKDYFKNMLSLPADDDYEDDVFEEESFFEEEEISSSSKPQKKSSEGTSIFDRKSKVVNLNSSQIQVVIVKPTCFEDAASIADHLTARKTVVLNLEAANRETSRRLLDFLGGTAYATKGTIKQIANSTYIITPANVDVLGELISDDYDAGMFLG